MTLTHEQIKEAVKLADGWAGGNSDTDIISVIAPEQDDASAWWIDDMPQYAIAALASQLISQVEDMGYGVCVQYGCVDITKNMQTMKMFTGGPNRDENSILACTEFLREKGE